MARATFRRREALVGAIIALVQQSFSTDSTLVSQHSFAVNHRGNTDLIFANAVDDSVAVGEDLAKALVLYFGHNSSREREIWEGSSCSQDFSGHCAGVRR